MTWQPVIGFEIHVELCTVSKMFCGCPADHFSKPPNTQTCPVCLGLPGALPVPNAAAIEWCIKLGLALGCKINLFSKFDRKNYFYPDLAKGYQISQYDLPFCYGGSLTLSSGKTIRITRVHMEEDTGKLQHTEIAGEKVTLVDFNRSGVPLVEIVTEPDFSGTEECLEYLKEIQQIVRTLGISSADMEKGSMRLEANISVRPPGSTDLPNYKIEVKNVNSFRYIKKAIDFELARQIEILNRGETPAQETRGFNEDRGETFSQRSKESAHDYRYFPEPDIPPLVFTPDQIATWTAQLPPLPAQLRSTLVTKYALSTNYAAMLSENPDMYKLFIQAAETGDVPPKQLADILVNKRFGSVLPPLPALLDLARAQTAVSTVTPDQIRDLLVELVKANPQVVAAVKAGKPQAAGVLIGQVKAKLGRVDIAQVQKILQELLP